MQMTEDAVMDGVQLVVVVILLGCLLIQMHGGLTVAVLLQEGFGTDHAGMMEQVTNFIDCASIGILVMCSLHIVCKQLEMLFLGQFFIMEACKMEFTSII